MIDIRRCLEYIFTGSYIDYSNYKKYSNNNVRYINGKVWLDLLLTEEFKNIIELAKEKIEPLINKETSRWTCYFKVKGEDVSSEFDCCDNEKCIKQTKADIRRKYGKGTHVEEVYYDNDGDHEKIETCCQCGKPLNEWLTWCRDELEYLEDNKPWTPEFLKTEGFLIYCILQSSPTMDYDISNHGNNNSDILENREQFFQRILQLAQSVIQIV